MCIDQSNRVWIGTNGKGVYLYDKQTDEFTQYLGDTNGNTLAFGIRTIIFLRNPVILSFTVYHLITLSLYRLVTLSPLLLILQ